MGELGIVDFYYFIISLIKWDIASGFARQHTANHIVENTEISIFIVDATAHHAEVVGYPPVVANYEYGCRAHLEQIDGIIHKSYRAAVFSLIEPRRINYGIGFGIQFTYRFSQFI